MEEVCILWKGQPQGGYRSKEFGKSVLAELSVDQLFVKGKYIYVSFCQLYVCKYNICAEKCAWIYLEEPI